MHLAGQLAEHLVEIGDGDISILDLPHLDAAVKCAGAGLTERFGERVGIRYGVSKLEPAIPVVVHPDGKDIKLGQSGAGVPVPIHRDPGGLRGDEVCFVVGDQLDAVLAGLKRQRPRERRCGSVGGRGGRGRFSVDPGQPAFIHPEGRAVHPPLDLADAAALIGEHGFDGDLVAIGRRSIFGTNDGNLRRGAAADHLVEIELRRRFLDLSGRVAGELLLHEIRPIQGLVHLVDADGREAADDMQQFGSLCGGHEKSLRRDRQPFARRAMHGGRKKLVCLGRPDRTGAVAVPDRQPTTILKK